MKTFKSYISEAETANKPPSSAEKARDRQTREKEDMKSRHDRELEKAREQDFRKKESDRKQQELQKKAEKNAKAQESVEDDSADAEYVPEYLEDGTLVLVRNYKSNTPGQ